MNIKTRLALSASLLCGITSINAVNFLTKANALIDENDPHSIVQLTKIVTKLTDSIQKARETATLRMDGKADLKMKYYTKCMKYPKQPQEKLCTKTDPKTGARKSTCVFELSKACPIVGCNNKKECLLNALTTTKVLLNPILVDLLGKEGLIPYFFELAAFFELPDAAIHRDNMNKVIHYFTVANDLIKEIQRIIQISKQARENSTQESTKAESVKN